MAEQLARVAQVSEVMGEQDALLRDTFAEHQVSPPVALCLTVAVSFSSFLSQIRSRLSMVFTVCRCWRYFEALYPSCIALFLLQQGDWKYRARDSAASTALIEMYVDLL